MCPGTTSWDSPRHIRSTSGYSWPGWRRWPNAHGLLPISAPWDRDVERCIGIRRMTSYCVRMARDFAVIAIVCRRNFLYAVTARRGIDHTPPGVPPGVVVFLVIGRSMRNMGQEADARNVCEGRVSVLTQSSSARSSLVRTPQVEVLSTACAAPAHRFDLWREHVRKVCGALDVRAD